MLSIQGQMDASSPSLYAYMICTTETMFAGWDLYDLYDMWGLHDPDRICMICMTQLLHIKLWGDIGMMRLFPTNLKTDEGKTLYCIPGNLQETVISPMFGTVAFCTRLDPQEVRGKHPQPRAEIDLRLGQKLNPLRARDVHHVYTTLGAPPVP